MTLPQYAGNPANYPVTISEIDDSSPPFAANWNPGTDGLADRTAWLRATLGHGPALNWGAAFPSSVGFFGAQFGASALGPLSGLGAILAVDNTSPTIFEVWRGLGLDSGAAVAWAQIPTFGPTPGKVRSSAICEDPSTGDNWWVGIVDDTYVTRLYLANPGGGSAKISSIAGTGNVYGIEITTLGAYVITAVAAANAASAAFTSTNNGGTSFTSFATGIPAMPAGSSWELKSSGSAVLAIPYMGGFGAATGVWKTTDGHTWANAATLSFMAATDNVVGLAWDPQTGLWVIAIQTTTPTVYFYTSPDGVSWTSAGTPPATHMTIADMAAVKGTVVCTLADSSSAGPSGQIWSADDGATWYNGPASLFTNETTGFEGYMRSRISASPTGFLTSNTLWGRFSSRFGFPANSL